MFLETMLMTIKRAISYYNNTVHPWEIGMTRFLTVFSKVFPFFAQNISKKKLCVGFYSIFPPFPNGAAAASYYILKELTKHQEIDLRIIPVKRKIDKQLFSSLSLSFTTPHDPALDVIIFFGLGDAYGRYSENIIAKKVAWQTLHEDPKTQLSEQEIIDKLSNANLVCGLTRWATSIYHRQLPLVTYIPHGVDTSLFKKKITPQENFTCLFVSRTHYYKGLMPFLDTIPYVLKKDPHIYFKIIAPLDTNSPYLLEIFEKIHGLQTRYRENFNIQTDWIPYNEIAALYADASVLVFPSNNEGFGLPLIEAMSAEIPCIVLNKKPMSEIIQDGITGFCLNSTKDREKYHGFAFPDPH